MKSLLFVASICALSLASCALVEANQVQCKFTSTKPTPSEPRNVVANSSNAIADFSGHLKYYFDNKTTAYMPLELRAIKTKDMNKDHTMVELDLTCATWVFHLSFYERQYIVYNAYMKLNVPNGKFKACEMHDFFIFPEHIADGNHYKCERSIVDVCYQPMVLVPLVDMAYDRLEFEVHGEPAKIKRGQFSTEPQSCTQEPSSLEGALLRRITGKN